MHAFTSLALLAICAVPAIAVPATSSSTPAIAKRGINGTVAASIAAAVAPLVKVEADVGASASLPAAPALPVPALPLPILKEREAFNMPSVPAIGGNCPSTGSNQQSNQCSTGMPYCCSPDGDGGHVCEKGQVQCQQTVICCNNAGGMQLCLGNIDFNMPITLNINVNKRAAISN